MFFILNYFFIYDSLGIILIKTIMGLIPQHEAPKETFLVNLFWAFR
ncbi:hypothetical protein N403_00600 [Helicobacter pylori FD430]|nr:hypothetical protein N403_00600 [Helicobacter pylori FD430]EQL66259.1 hypothetical protein N408_07655 [Helicobacter pylori FD703]